ncbi:conserved hypothetical protein [Trichinella spiralis]|uniref:hypothetical protein n=1 Tax=Trichinella spiralis TaxID=6334 RepID=UPI0001EFE4B7|nr:conserved hypothetical protein [Trichinella spiralis]
MNHKAINKKYMKICSAVQQRVAVRNQGATAGCYIQANGVRRMNNGVFNTMMDEEEQ